MRNVSEGKRRGEEREGLMTLEVSGQHCLFTPGNLELTEQTERELALKTVQTSQPSRA